MISYNSSSYVHQGFSHTIFTYMQVNYCVFLLSPPLAFPPLPSLPSIPLSLSLSPQWMMDHWETEECYAKHGVDGTRCSMQIYLSEVCEFGCGSTTGEMLSIPPATTASREGGRNRSAQNSRWQAHRCTIWCTDQAQQPSHLMLAEGQPNLHHWIHKHWK